MNRDPDYVFACAGKTKLSIVYSFWFRLWSKSNITGASYPKMFLDHTMEDFEFLSNLNYLGQAYIAHVRELEYAQVIRIV